MIVNEVDKIRAEINSELQAMEAERMQLYEHPGSNIDPSKLLLNVSYPYSDVWDYDTSLVNLNLDKEREKGIASGRDFRITSHLPIQKQVKSMDGIFSPRFGQTLSDMEPFIDKYRCACGAMKYRIHEGLECPKCHTKVKYVDDDFGMFAWFVLDKFYVIHPNLYKDIESLVGGAQALINILDNNMDVDENGKVIEDKIPDKPLSAKQGNMASNRNLKKYVRRQEGGKKDIYDGKGMLYFYTHFDEIMDYYYNKASNKAAKKKWYDRIMEDREKVFTHSIPVYTTHLRPFEVNGDKSTMAFEGTNANYNMMSRIVHNLNNYDKYKMNQHPKLIDNLLWSLQREWNDLYVEIDAILSDKKGNVRLLAGGRCNFSGRSVIIQNPKLRADQVILPYPFLVTILQQQIINILVKTYNYSYNNARNVWAQSIDTPNKVVVQIIYGLIKARKEGLAVIINRNPSINRGSLLQMFCIDMSFDYTMSLPLTVLEILAADSTKSIGVTLAGMHGLKLSELLGRVNTLRATA